MILALTSLLLTFAPFAVAPPPVAAPLGSSCNASAQAAVQQALPALYNFEYAESEDGFHKASAADPHCAIAEWGVAMSHWHELWGWPDADAMSAGWKAAQSAQARAGFATPLEREYVAAMAAFYAPAGGKQERTTDERAAAYLARMRELHAAFPDDRNGTVFLALAILADNDRGTREERLLHAREAGALLQPVFGGPTENSTQDAARAGAAHYLIHAYDMPELAPQGLVAARAYARIAPDSPHALHMPAHIFAQLGLWDEDVASNVASYEAAKTQPGHVAEKAHEELHALDFLQYALLQRGEWDKAAEITQAAAGIARAHHDDDSDYSIVWLPMRQRIEQNDWNNTAANAAVTSAVEASSDPFWKAEGAWFLVQAAWHTNNVAASASSLAALKKGAEKVRHNHKFGDSTVLDILVPEAEAWDAMLRGDTAAAIARMQAAAAAEAKPGEYGGFRKPAEELLADLYLAAGDKAAARSAYAECLRTHPNRRLSLLGSKAAA